MPLWIPLWISQDKSCIKSYCPKSSIYWGLYLPSTSSFSIVLSSLPVISDTLKICRGKKKSHTKRFKRLNLNISLLNCLCKIKTRVIPQRQIREPKNIVTAHFNQACQLKLFSDLPCHVNYHVTSFRPPIDRNFIKQAYKSNSLQTFSVLMKKSICFQAYKVLTS